MPQPREIERAVRFNPTQGFGMLVIAAIPLLALFQIFDTRQAKVAASSAGIHLDAEYPRLFRHKTYDPLRASARNDTGAELEKLEIKIEKGYVDRFAEVQFDPQPNEVDDKDYVFEFERVPNGETREVHLHLQDDTMGPNTGYVMAEGGGGTVRATFSTFVLP